MCCINALYRAIRESPRCKTPFVGDDVLGVPKSVNFVLVKRLFDFCSSSSHLQTKNRLFCGTPRTSSPTRLDLSCETNDTFDVGQDFKRSQNGRKMGVDTPKSLIFRSERALVIESVLYPTRHLRIWNFFHTHQRIRLRFIFTKTVFVAVISPSVHRHI